VSTRLMQEVVACGPAPPAAWPRHRGHGAVHPNSRNVIPGRVKFSIDLRNATDALVDQMADEVKAFAAKLAPRTAACRCEIELVSGYPAQAFHTDCVDAVARAAKLGYSNMPAVSGAGHDAVYMAKLAPAA
jgi:N-carbamoyl-L-amino-acid hydrolase